MRGYITVADIARERGCDRRTAWRWLRQLADKHGAKVVEREGKLTISKDELALVMSHLPQKMDPQVARELVDLKKRVSEAEDRQNALARELYEFRRQAHEWFMSKKSTSQP